MTTSPPRKRRIAAFLALALAIPGVAATSLAYYNDAESIEGNTFVSGVLDLALGETTTSFSVTDLAPGDSLVRELTVINAGTTPLTYDATLGASATSGDLAQVLQVSLLTDLDADPTPAGPWSGESFVSQAGFATNDVTATSETRRALPAGASETVYAYVHLDRAAPTSYAGLDANLTITFNAEQSTGVERARTFALDLTAPGVDAGAPVVLPVAGDVDVTVDWGDGTVEEVDAANPSHTYDTPGAYEVSVEGSYTALTLPEGENNAAALQTAVLDADAGLESLSYAFRDATNLKTVEGALPATVTDLSGAFSGATSFNQDISSWDTSNVTTVASMFENATSFNQDLSGWNTDAFLPGAMKNFTRGATSYTEPTPDWIDPNDLISTFTYDLTAPGTSGNAVSLPVQGTVDVTVDWGDGTVQAFTTAKPAHTYATAAQYNIKVTGTYTTLSNLAAINSQALVSAELGAASGITSASHGFENAVNLTRVYGALPPTVTDTSYMFSGALAFNQDISAWDTSNVTDMSYMFQHAFAFNQGLSAWDTSSVTNMSYMFRNAVAFNGNISAWDTSSVTNMSNMFHDVRLFNQDISAWDTSSVTDMTYMFTNLRVFNQDLSAWDTSNVTDMSYMFQSAESFNQDLSGWNVARVAWAIHFARLAGSWTLQKPAFSV